MQRLAAQIESAEEDLRTAAAAEGSPRRREHLPRGARRHRRRRSGDLRRRPVPHVRALRRESRADASRSLSESPGEHGGYKEIISRIAGKGAFSRLKFESGTHRVQRVPATEAQGRIHTSAVHRRHPARGRGGRRNRDQPGRPAHRHLPLLRRRRPARQQDRFRDAHHAPADRHRGRMPGRALAAQEPLAGHGAAEGAAARRRAGEAAERRRRSRASCRSAAATAPSASAPTTSRRAASPTTAST